MTCADQMRWSLPRLLSERIAFAQATDQIVEVLISEERENLAEAIRVTNEMYLQQMCKLFGHDEDTPEMVCALCGL